jgi:LPXTG-motif cell wall-anchored protein
VKKLIFAFITVAFIGLVSSPASAQNDPEPSVPIECAEEDLPDPEGGCRQYYPPTTPVSTTTTTTTVLATTTTTTKGASGGPTTTVAGSTTTVAAIKPPNSLPQTGSGVSPILGMGALLVLGGGLIVVAARRRSTSTSPAT